MLWSALADAMVNMWDVDVATFLKPAGGVQPLKTFEKGNMYFQLQKAGSPGFTEGSFAVEMCFYSGHAAGELETSAFFNLQCTCSFQSIYAVLVPLGCGALARTRTLLVIGCSNLKEATTSRFRKPPYTGLNLCFYLNSPFLSQDLMVYGCSMIQ